MADNIQHTLIVELDGTHGFWRVTCPEGDLITAFRDGVDDPLDYYAGREVYLPKFRTEEDIRAQYRCVTEEEHIAYEKAREEARIEYENERQKERER